MSNTLWEHPWVDVGEFRVYRSGKVEYLYDGDYHECNQMILFPTYRSNYKDIPEVHIGYKNEEGRWTRRPLYPVMMTALTGSIQNRKYFVRPKDGDVRDVSYKNFEIFYSKSELIRYNKDLLENGEFCNVCYSYIKNGEECKGCKRYNSYLEELSEMYPNTSYLSEQYKALLDMYNDNKELETIVEEVLGFVNSVNRFETMLDNLYDADDTIWHSYTFKDIYRKMTLEDTITANDLVRLGLSVDEFVEMAQNMNPKYKYILFEGEVMKNDISILIKESAVID